jgi:hypothetical protein
MQKSCYRYLVLAVPMLVACGGQKLLSPDTERIVWPKEVRTLTTLDAPAIVAAHAALQSLLARFEKEGVNGSCGYSAKGLEVIVGEGGGMYIVLINQRMDKCGWVVPPGFTTETDWFEQYAVSPEGKVLARFSYNP